METLINYVLEAAISLGLLSVYYLLVSRKYNSPQFNRYFLVFALVFSVVVPFLNVSFYNSSTSGAVATGTAFVMLDMVTIYGDVMSQSVVPVVNNSPSIRIIYFIGFIVLALRMVWALIKLNILTGKSKVTRVEGIRVIVTGNNYQPFTFLQTVIIPLDVWESNHKKEVLVHESIHVQQKHSIDLILLELILLIQWFNPFAWLMRRLMQENHEFLADRAVIDTGFEVREYQKLLLYEVMGTRFELGNNFNHSLTKKRLKMMTHKVNRKRSQIASALSFVLVAGLFFLFACETEPEAYVNPQTAFIMNGQLVQPQEILTKAPGESENIVRVEIDGQEHFLKPELTNESNFTTSMLTINEAKTRYKNLAFADDVQKVILIEQLGDENSEVFMVVEEMPKFPGGKDSLMSFLRTSIRYPKIAMENGIQGRVFCQFVVGKEGVVKDAQVVRGVDPSLDAEALRVINSMPDWKPGKQRGKDVNVQFMLPINFALNTEKGIEAFVEIDNIEIKNSTMSASTRFFIDTETQKRKVSGHVQDENGEDLPGVSVVGVNQSQGFSSGTVSDENGNFILTLPENSSEIQLSFVGKESIKMTIPPPPPIAD